jgi:hypothetical protein
MLSFLMKSRATMICARVFRWGVILGTILTLFEFALLRCAWCQAPPGTVPPAAAARNMPDRTGGVPGASASGTVEKTPPPPNPIVEAVRQSNPRTPEELVRAVQIMIDASEWTEAEKYLQLLLDLELDDEAAYRLYRKVGPAFLVRLQRQSQLQPKAKEWADRLHQAVERWMQNPARLTALFQQLSDARQRPQALAGLREARPHSIVHGIAILLDAGQSELHASVQEALKNLGPEVIPAMTAVLESDRAEGIARIATIVLESGDPSALRTLAATAYRHDLPEEFTTRLQQSLSRTLGKSFTQSVVVHWLENNFLTAFDARRSTSRTPQAEVPLWIWNETSGTLQRQLVSPPDVARWRSVQSARALWRVHPDNRLYRIYFLAALAEWHQHQAGPTERLEALPGQPPDAQDPDLLSDVLQFALERSRSSAALWAARQLGRVGSPELLAPPGQRAPLVQALSFPDAFVQAAATQAIMKLNPQRPFTGSAVWRDTLGYFLAAQASRRVLIGNPRVDEAQSWAGYLREMGFQVDLADTGRAVLDQLVKVPDYEFVLLVDRLDRPPVMETIQLARNIPAAARMRFAILCHDANFETLRLAAEEDSSVLVHPRVHNAEGMGRLLVLLDAIAGQRPLPPEERTELVMTILDWLASHAAHPTAAQFDLLRLEDRVLSLAESPTVGEKACAVLGEFATARSQKRLVDTASQIALPLSLRQAAAAAFARAVAQRGVLLTSPQILEQYDRYNASAALDGDTQRILGDILDSIEAGLARAESRAPANLMGR